MDVIVSVISSEGGKVPKRRKRRRHVSPSADWHQVEDDNPWSAGDDVRRRSRDEGMFASMRRFGSGVRSLYRGFWGRYVVRVVGYAFEEVGRGEDGW